MITKDSVTVYVNAIMYYKVSTLQPLQHHAKKDQSSSLFNGCGVWSILSNLIILGIKGGIQIIKMEI